MRERSRRTRRRIVSPLADWRSALLAIAPVIALIGSPACAPPPEPPAVRLSGYRAATAEDLSSQGWRTDFTRLTVPLSSIRTASLPRTAFVPIVSGGTLPASEVTLDDSEPVIVVRGREETRAWPIVWLLRRELVLDELDGVPLAVTFCSLCSSTRVWDRRTREGTLDLAVSGLLLDGNSLLYDRETESLWHQIDGRAIAGAHAGARLDLVPSFVISFGELRRARPDARVMHPPEPAPDPPLRLLRAENVADGTPPEWLSLGCPLPLQPLLEVTEDDQLIAVAGPSIENLETTVIFRDPRCAMPFRDDAGHAAPVTGAAVAFLRRSGAHRLTFDATADGIRDIETGSLWNLLGEAVDGPLTGQLLELADQVRGFRFALTPLPD